MTARQNRLIFPGTPLLVLACTVFFGASVVCRRAYRIPATDIQDPSGQRLASIFEGIPSDLKYDLKQIRESNALGMAASCSKGNGRGIWDILFGLFGPTTAQADQYCTQTPCASHYYTQGSESCAGSCTGSRKQVVYLPGANNYAVGNQQLSTTGCGERLATRGLVPAT